MPDSTRIGPDEWKVRCEVFDHLKPFALHLQFQKPVAIGDKVRQSHGFLAQIVAARFDTRQIEDLVDQVQQVVSAFKDVAGWSYCRAPKSIVRPRQ